MKPRPIRDPNCILTFTCYNPQDNFTVRSRRNLLGLLLSTPPSSHSLIFHALSRPVNKHTRSLTHLMVGWKIEAETRVTHLGPKNEIEKRKKKVNKTNVAWGSVPIYQETFSRFYVIRSAVLSSGTIFNVRCFASYGKTNNLLFFVSFCTFFWNFFGENPWDFVYSVSLRECMQR